MLSRGELQALFRAVDAVGPTVAEPGREHAAVLACGSGAVLSHRSAAYLYGLLPYPDRPSAIDITVAGDHRRGRACQADELERAVAEAFALRLTNRAHLLRAGTRPGAGRLRRLLDGRPPARTRSDPERILLRGVRAARLPEPETNVKVGGWEVDFLWREVRLAVEVDAYSTHSSPRAFDRDRRKDADLAAAELTVQRFTVDHVRDEPDRVIAWITARVGVHPSL